MAMERAGFLYIVDDLAKKNSFFFARAPYPAKKYVMYLPNNRDVIAVVFSRLGRLQNGSPVFV